MSDDEIPLMLEREYGAPEFVPQIAVGFGLYPVRVGDRNGMPFYQDKLYCKKVVPGDNKSVVLQPVREEDKTKYPQAYKAFENRASQKVEGYPIEQWPVVTRAEALTLKAMGVPTVEMLAAVHEGNMNALGHSGREWVAKAKAFTAAAKDSEFATKAAAEKLELQNELASMKQQMADLIRAVNAKDETKRGPGRPRKQPEQVA